MAGVALSAIPSGSPAAGTNDRTLKLFNVHTNERAVITYMRNGRLDPEGVKQMNQFLRDWRKNQPTKMDPRLFDVIWEAYQESGSKDYIHIISAYRSPTTNEMLRSRSRGVAKNSQHTRGKAMDFFLPDVPLSKIREIGLKMQAGGVGFYPTSGSPFVHLDVGSVRHWPRMTRQQLVKVFPKGGTLHVPSDGKPLPGYDQALAAYKSRQAVGHLAVADLGPDVEEDAEEAKAMFVVASGGPGIVPGIDTVLPRRRPGSEPVMAAEPAAEPLIPTVVALADLPLPRPAPVTTRALMDAPVPAAPIAAPAFADTPPDQPAVDLPAVAQPVVSNESFDSRAIVVADAAATSAMPLPRPAPVTTRAYITAEDAPPAIAPRPAVIVASLGGASDTVNMAQARARAIAAIRAQLLRQEKLPEPDPIGAAVMAFAAPTGPALRSAPAPDLDIITGSVPLPRARPLAPRMTDLVALPRQTTTEPTTDPLASFTVQADGEQQIAVLTRLGSTRQAHFATLVPAHADQMPELLWKPGRAIAITFSGFVYDGLRTDRFAGRAVAPLTTVNLGRPDGYYVTAQR